MWKFGKDAPVSCDTWPFELRCCCFQKMNVTSPIWRVDSSGVERTDDRPLLDGYFMGEREYPGSEVEIEHVPGVLLNPAQELRAKILTQFREEKCAKGVNMVADRPSARSFR